MNFYVKKLIFYRFVEKKNEKFKYKPRDTSEYRMSIATKYYTDRLVQYRFTGQLTARSNLSQCWRTPDNFSLDKSVRVKTEPDKVLADTLLDSIFRL